MSISPAGPVSTLVPDAPPRPSTAPAPDQQTESRSTQEDKPSQAVTPPSTDTRAEPEPARDRKVDIYA